MGAGLSRLKPLKAYVKAEDTVIQSIRADNDPVFQEVKLLQLLPAIYDAYDVNEDGWLQLEEMYQLLSDYIHVLDDEIPRLWAKGLFKKVDAVIAFLENEAPREAAQIRRQWQADKEDMLESLGAFLDSKHELLNNDPLWIRIISKDVDDEELVAKEHRHHFKGADAASSPMAYAAGAGVGAGGAYGPQAGRTLASPRGGAGAGAGLSSFAFASSAAPAGSAGSPSGFLNAPPPAYAQEPLAPPAVPRPPASPPMSSRADTASAWGSGSGVGASAVGPRGTTAFDSRRARTAKTPYYTSPHFAKLIQTNVKMSPAMRALMAKQQQQQLQAQQQAAEAQLRAHGGMRLGGRLLQRGELFVADAIDPKDGLLQRTLVQFKSYERTSGLPEPVYYGKVEKWRSVPKNVFLLAWRDVLDVNDLSYRRISRTLFVRTQVGPVLRAFVSEVLRRTPEAETERKRALLAVSLGLGADEGADAALGADAASALQSHRSPHSAHGTAPGSAGGLGSDVDGNIVVIGGGSGGGGGSGLGTGVGSRGFGNGSGHRVSLADINDTGAAGGSDFRRSAIDDDEDLNGILGSVVGLGTGAGTDSDGNDKDSDGEGNGTGVSGSHRTGPRETNDTDDDDDDDDDNADETTPAQTKASAPAPAHTKTGDSPFPVRFRTDSDEEADAADDSDDDDDNDDGEANKTRSVSQAIEAASDDDGDASSDDGGKATAAVGRNGQSKDSAHVRLHDSDENDDDDDDDEVAPSKPLAAPMRARDSDSDDAAGDRPDSPPAARDDDGNGDDDEEEEENEEAEAGPAALAVAALDNDDDDGAPMAAAMPLRLLTPAGTVAVADASESQTDDDAVPLNANAGPPAAPLDGDDVTEED